jgi:toxin ParE1/3/4
VPYLVTFSAEAQADLVELEEYLSERFYPRNAERYVHRIAQACFALAHAPHRGTSREDLGFGVRVIGFERRLSIYFRVRSDEIIIAGIFYGGETPKNLG